MIPVEAIQQVIDDLKLAAGIQKNKESSNFAQGAYAAYRDSIGLLEEVIAQYAPSDKRDAAEPERNDQCKQTE